MSEGAAVLRDSAQAAVGCDAAAEELVSGDLRQKACMQMHGQTCMTMRLPVCTADKTS